MFPLSSPLKGNYHNGNLGTISFDIYLSNFKQLELKLLINGKNVTSSICI